jgi:hypothetical protein
LESRGKQAAETKKKGKPEGAKLLRNELEGRNKFEKGDGRFTKKQKQRGGGFSGPKLENKIILFGFPAAAPLSPPWPSATTIQHRHSATIGAATSSNRGETETKQRRREEQRLVVTAQRRRRTVPHHLGTTAVLPLHRHNSTVLPVIEAALHREKQKKKH